MCESLEAIHNALTFMEANLREQVGVADCAAAAGYSLFHFVRVFNKTVHHTPYDYLIRRRLSKAARELVSTRRRITDIAVDYRFHNLETFSRAFKRMSGLQPNQARAGAGFDPRGLLSARTPAHLQIIRDLAPPRCEQQPALVVAGLMTRVGGPADIPSLWAALAAEVGDWTECYGVLGYPNDWMQNGCFYMAAVPAASLADLGPALVTRTLPAGPRACFPRPALPESLPLLRDYAYQTWLPQAGKRPVHALEIEQYEGTPAARPGCRLLIPIE